AQIVLAYLVFKYRERGQTAMHQPSRRSMTLIALIPIAFVTMEIIFSMLSQKVWAEMHMKEPSRDAVQIEVNGQQFKWYFRYPGKDRVFGLREPALVDDSSQNFLGVDFEGDAKAKDDVITGSMKVPWERPVVVLIRSRDVLHSFFVRELRLKQDAVPGLEIKVSFNIRKDGLFKFNLEGLNAADLDGKKITQTLRDRFSAHGINLDEAAELSIVEKPAKRWEIRNRVQDYYDATKYYPVKYAILFEEGKLNVYKTTYEVFCAELCGQGHYGMRAEMEVLSPEEFEAWERTESESSASYR
ncbi:MAG: hypothetical protein HY291_16070, partial [Planctomycetes bacterium]|nr:hypothetical protein [Planctomycetota bacterium]